MIMASFQIDELDEVLNDIERDSSMESVTSENSVDTAVLIGINDVLVDGGMYFRVLKILNKKLGVRLIENRK